MHLCCMDTGAGQSVGESGTAGAATRGDTAEMRTRCSVDRVGEPLTSDASGTRLGDTEGVGFVNLQKKLKP